MLSLDDDELAIALVALDEAIGCLDAEDKTSSNAYVIRKMQALVGRIEQHQNDMENGDAK